MTEHRPTIVLELVPDPTKVRVDNPYTALLVNALKSERLEIRHFTWRIALVGRYDVVHAHWPEQLIRHNRPIAAFIKKLLLLAWLVRLRIQRIPIVRTLHNEAPHERGGSFEAKLLSAFDRATTDYIVLNPTTNTPGGRVHLIPHGHYRDWFPPVEAPSQSGVLLAFGLVRPYKGTDDLIVAFRDLDRQDLSLTIAGKSSTPQYGEELARLAGDDPRVTLDLRFVPEPELITLIESAEVVVLPYPEMQNSGAALLALSMNRPVVVLNSPSTRLLEEEFGANWVQRIDASVLTAQLLDEAVGAIRTGTRAPDGPEMDSRDWKVLGAMTSQVLQEAAQPRQ